MARGCQGTEMPYIFINRNQYGTGMPDFWPIQLETGALPSVPFRQLLVFICLPTSRKLLIIINAIYRPHVGKIKPFKPHLIFFLLFSHAQDDVCIVFLYNQLL